VLLLSLEEEIRVQKEVLAGFEETARPVPAAAAAYW
jgi:hypothetical protein